MSRSLWKLPYIESSLLRKISKLKNRKNAKSFSIKTWSRASVISSGFVGLRFRVHNGKTFFPLFIVPEMIGYKLGEFVSTRVRYEFKKKKKKK